MIVIVTDSTAYLTKQEAKELGVLYIPMTYTIDGVAKTEGCIDMVQDTDKSCFAVGELTTSQPGMGVILHRFAKLRATGCEVLCLTISSRMSGTYSNAMVCAKELGDGIRVVDSWGSAGALVAMIREARRLLDSGLGLDETAGALLKMRDRVKTYFSVEDLTPLRRSGRLGMIRQSIGTILNQRPILTCRNGTVVCCNVVKGTNAQIRKLVELVPDDALGVTVQCFSEHGPAMKMAELLERRFHCEIPIRRIGPVLGIHLGFDAIGTQWIDPED